MSTCEEINTNQQLITNCFKFLNHYECINDLLLNDENNKTKINILYFNAQSIRNKWDSIKLFINSLNSLAHVIVMTETKIYVNENKFFELENYTAYHSNRVQDKWTASGRGGGAAIYVHNSILSVLVSQEYYDNNNFVIAKMIRTNTNIIAVYKPPNTNIMNFIEKFEIVLAQNPSSIIIGDFNMYDHTVKL